MPVWLAVLGAVLVALVALSSLVLVVRGAWKEGKIAELRADNDDLRKRDLDRIQEIAELRNKEAELELRVLTLERDKEVLIEAATQAGAVGALTVAFEAHRKAVQERQGEILSKEDRLIVWSDALTAKIDEALALMVGGAPS